MNESELLWFQDGQDYGWNPPVPAPYWKRVWGIRHIRFVFLCFKVSRHQYNCSKMGFLPNPYDDWVLYGVLKGWV